MDRSCPKRKKTKKIITDGDVNKFLSSHDNNQTEKIVHLTKVPEEWETGLTLNLYHDGFTIGLDKSVKMSSERIGYDESNFINSIEEGQIPDELTPVLSDLRMLSENKLVVSVVDYRGFPRPGTTDPYVLDFPITTQHVLFRSTQSMILELHDTIGEKVSHDQLTQLENYLLMLHSKPLCLDTSTQVFEIKNDIHQNQNMLNVPQVRRLITRHTRSSDICSEEQSDFMKQLQVVIDHSKQENQTLLKLKSTSIDRRLTKPKIPIDPKSSPNYLNEILELCTKRISRLTTAAKMQQSLEQQQHLQQHLQQQQPGGVPSQPVVSPRTPSYPTNPIPHHKPFMNSKPGVSGVGVMNPGTPMSPILQPQQPVLMASPLTPGAPPHLVHQMSPKNIASVNRVQSDLSKTVRGYNPGYMVSQPMNQGQRPNQQVQRMPVTMMQISQAQQPGGMIQQQQQPPGMLRAPNGQIMHAHMGQPMRPGHMDQSMNKSMQNTGMMMSQQYPRGYGYPNVQPINRGYVDQAQYIPVPQQRPQVLQIALPPNMSPQNRPRQGGPAMNTNPGMAQSHQGPLHRVPFSQLQMGGIQNPNLQNPQMQNPNIYNQFR